MDCTAAESVDSLFYHAGFIKCIGVEKALNVVVITDAFVRQLVTTPYFFGRVLPQARIDGCWSRAPVFV